VLAFAESSRAMVRTKLFG